MSRQEAETYIEPGAIVGWQETPPLHFAILFISSLNSLAKHTMRNYPSPPGLGIVHMVSQTLEVDGEILDLQSIHKLISRQMFIVKGYSK